MSRNDDFQITDILEAADKLAERLQVAQDEWLLNEDLRLITERLVEVIGEATRPMSDEVTAQYPDVDWSGFVGLRNVLVHAYHRIQPDLLWTAATVDVPALAASLRAGPPA